MAERARKTIQLATAFLGDQLVASLLANQTNQVEYTLHTEFELPTKSKSVLSDDLAVGGWRWRLTVIIQLTQPSFTGTWAELGNINLQDDGGYLLGDLHFTFSTTSDHVQEDEAPVGGVLPVHHSQCGGGLCHKDCSGRGDKVYTSWC